MHRHILVDGKIVDRPSFRVKPGQTLQVKPKSQATVPFQVAAAGAHRDVLPNVPGYLDVAAREAQLRPGATPRSAPRSP